MSLNLKTLNLRGFRCTLTLITFSKHLSSLEILKLININNAFDINPWFTGYQNSENPQKLLRLN